MLFCLCLSDSLIFVFTQNKKSVKPVQNLSLGLLWDFHISFSFAHLPHTPNPQTLFWIGLLKSIDIRPFSRPDRSDRVRISQDNGPPLPRPGRHKVSRRPEGGATCRYLSSNRKSIYLLQFSLLGRE